MSPSRLSWVGAVALCAILAIDSSARAQVLEIGQGGAVVVHDRPEITADAGYTPIATAPKHGRATRQGRPAPQAAVATGAALSSAADSAQLSSDLVEAVAWSESRLHHGAVSPKGAIGEMQLMPTTARTLGVDPFDGAQNLRGGAAYLRGLLTRYDGDVVRALAAYNAGPGAVDRYRGVPPFKETQAYVAAVLDHMSAHAAGAPASSRR